MEHYFYPAVRIAAAGYILYKVWLLLFRDRLFGLWDRIPVRGSRPKIDDESKSHAGETTTGVVGKAHGGYIANPKSGLDPVPMIPVESVTGNTAYEEQDEEFEEGPPMEHPSEEELYGAGNEQSRVTDYSTGRTFEQIVEALAYMSAPVEDDEMKMRTAETLWAMRGAMLLDVVGREENCIEATDRVIAECLDTNGERLSRRKTSITGEQLASFNADDYI
jgi:hypothetical protein